jgi:glucokinase
LVSGAGLVNIYEFLHHRENNVPSPKLHEILLSGDPAAAISDSARSGDLLAQRAISLFLTIYGAVIGDIALVTLAYGGIYVTGGIAPKLLEEIRGGKFIEACMRKGRMSPLLLQMPVIVILSQDVGLRGAALVASQL